MVILTHWACQSEEGGDAMSKEASARQLAELVASLREEKEVGWMSEKRVFMDHNLTLEVRHSGG